MRRISVLALAAVFGLGACGEAEVDDVPETAEVEPEGERGELELDEETVLGLDDIGEDLLATGWVSGAPLANGFFLRTEDDRVIFVQNDARVKAGDMVRVVGPLVATEAMVFEGWEAEAFEAGFEAEWDVETVVYIDAFSVTPLGESEGSTEMDTTEAMDRDAADSDTAGSDAGAVDAAESGESGSGPR